MISPWLSGLVDTATPSSDDYIVTAWRLRAEAADTADRHERERLVALANRWVAAARRKWWSDHRRGAR